MIEQENTTEIRDMNQVEDEKSRKGNFNIFEANMIFLVLAAVFLTVGAYVQSQNVLSGLLITEYGIVLIPVVVYAVATKKNLKKVFSLKRITLKTTGKIILIAVCLIPIIALANLITILIIELFSDSIVMDIPTAQTGIEYLGLMFIISITAGICEEGFFRGMVLNAYENELGKKWGALFSGLLFAIFHFNPQNFFGPLILGIVFAYLVQLTGSIVAGVVAHAANNGIAVTMGFLINLITPNIDAVTQSEALFDNIGMLLYAIAIYGVIAFGSRFGLVKLIESIKKDYAEYKIGDLLNFNKKDYQIINHEEEKIYIKETNSESILVTDRSKLSNRGIWPKYSLWDQSKLSLKLGVMVPVMVALVLYGYVIYFAYIKGVS